MMLGDTHLMRISTFPPSEFTHPVHLSGFPRSTTQSTEQVRHTAPINNASVYESHFSQFRNPEVVPDNMQPGLCVTVMAGDDKETHMSIFASFSFPPVESSRA